MSEQEKKKTEDRLVVRLRETLASKFERIEVITEPNKYRKQIKPCLESVLGYVPILQPDLDMVLWRGSETIAVEVKVFTPPKMRSFYEGIGQALALHRYGFDYAALWLLFLNASDDDLRRGSTAWEFVRKLRLPLDFTFFKVEAVNGSIDSCGFRPMQYLDSQRSYELRKIDDPRFNIHFDRLNPLAQECEQRVIRKALDLWFDGTLSIERLRSEIGSCVDLSRAAQSREIRVLLQPTNSTSSSGV